MCCFLFLKKKYVQELENNEPYCVALHLTPAETLLISFICFYGLAGQYWIPGPGMQGQSVFTKRFCGYRMIFACLFSLQDLTWSCRLEGLSYLSPLGPAVSLSVPGLLLSPLPFLSPLAASPIPGFQSCWSHKGGFQKVPFIYAPALFSFLFSL